MGKKIGAEEHRQHAEWLKDYKRLLEQEPCEEAISRQAVVGYLCTHCPDDAECFKDCDDIKNIKAFPPVTPQPKIGHWEYVQYDSNPKIGNYHCSVCRHIIIPFKNQKYCPNCGAKMEGE